MIVIKSRIPVSRVITVISPPLDLCRASESHTWNFHQLETQTDLRVALRIRTKFEAIEPQDLLESITKTLLQFWTRAESLENLSIYDWCVIVHRRSLWEGEEDLNVVVGVLELLSIPLQNAGKRSSSIIMAGTLIESDQSRRRRHGGSVKGYCAYRTWRRMGYRKSAEIHRPLKFLLGCNEKR